MNRASQVLAVALLMTVSLGAVAELSLDREGLWRPEGFHQSEGASGDRALINDGSFELGPPPASAWTESSTPPCEWIGIFSGSWYVSAYDGEYDYWAGGYCLDVDSGLNIPASSSVAQTVTVAPGGSDLSFHYIAFRPDADDVPQDIDHAYIAVNGEEIWTLDFLRANNTYPFWTGPETISLADWAGQEIELGFGCVAEGNVTGNVRFDYIELTDQTSAETSSWSMLKERF